MRRRRGMMDLDEAARLGAVAGLIGGAVTLAARRAQELGLLGKHESSDAGWDDLLLSVAKRRRLRVRRSRLVAAGILAHAAYSAMLGATYGIVRTRRFLPKEAEGALSSALVYAAHAPTLIMTARGPTRQPRSPRTRAKRQLIPLGAHALFGMTTTLAFRLLSDR